MMKDSNTSVFKSRVAVNETREHFGFNDSKLEQSCDVWSNQCFTEDGRRKTGFDSE